MACAVKSSDFKQVQSLIKGLQLEKGLPFSHLLPPSVIDAALPNGFMDGRRNRVYTPHVTLWAFLSQVVDHAPTKDATARVNAYRVANDLPECSADPSSYCEARQRFPLQTIMALTRDLGTQLHRNSEPAWQYQKNRVFIVDGTSIKMDDTAANQAKYPQETSQKPGLGSPIMRLVVLFSLDTGAVVNCVTGPHHGDETGETTLFRKMWDVLEPGDIIIADRNFDSYEIIALLMAKGVDVIFGRNASRKPLVQDEGSQVYDKAATWLRPKFDSNRFEREEWRNLPRQVQMREIEFQVETGSGTETVSFVTTRVDQFKYSDQYLIDLFKERWNCELDIRDIKTTLEMNHVSAKTPEMVEKIVWTHLLGYNLIRAEMAKAARKHNVAPRKLSFSSARYQLKQFLPMIVAAKERVSQRLINAMHKAMTKCQVGNRPGRNEPREIKKVSMKYKKMTVPRQEQRRNC